MICNAAAYVMCMHITHQITCTMCSSGKPCDEHPEKLTITCWLAVRAPLGSSQPSLTMAAAHGSRRFGAAISVMSLLSQIFCLKQVETTALASASAVARMAQLVDRAVSEQSPMETLVMRFARVYTPLVVAACIAIAFLPWAFDSQHHKVGY